MRFQQSKIGYVVGQEITIPAIEDVCDAHKATVVEIHEDLLCVVTEGDEYGEIDLELLLENAS